MSSLSNTILACFIYFLGYPLPSSTNGKDVKTINRGICIRTASIGNTYIRDTCIRNTSAGNICISGACTKGDSVKNIYIKGIS